MNYRATIVLVASMLLSVPAIGADWIFVSENSQGDTVEVDISSIRQDGPITKSWSRWIYQDGITLKDGKRAGSSKSMLANDCVHGTFNVIQSVYYATADGGEVVRIFNDREYMSSMDEPPPESIGYALQQFVCDKKEQARKIKAARALDASVKRSQKITDPVNRYLLGLPPDKAAKKAKEK